MMPLPTNPDELVALGAFTGAQVLVVCFSVIIANAYRERALLVHAAATMVAVAAVQALVGGHPFVAQAALLMVMAIDGMQLRDLVSHAGALRNLRRWLVATSLGLLPALALARPGHCNCVRACRLGAVFLYHVRACQKQPGAGWLPAMRPGEGIAWLVALSTARQICRKLAACSRCGPAVPASAGAAELSRTRLRIKRKNIDR